MQSSIYQEWIQEDIKEAVSKASVQTAARNIIVVLEERFDSLRRIREKIHTIQDTDRLRFLLKKSVKVDSLEEFERILDAETNKKLEESP